MPFKRFSRTLLALFVLSACLLAVPLIAQQRPTFRSGVEVVLIDVNVVDKSHQPVGDLKPEDFAVTVDRKPRTVVSAQFIRYDVRTTTTKELSSPATALRQPADSTPAPARNLLIVIDNDSMEPGDGQVAKKAAETFLARLAPGDRVGVATIPWLRSEITLTRNRDEVRKALSAVITGNERFRPDPYNIGIAEAFDVERGDSAAMARILARECRIGDRYCAEEVKLLVRQVQLQAHLRGERSLDSLRDLGEALKQVEGPKTMVLVSGGAPPADVRSGYPYSRIEAALAAGQVTLYTLYIEQQQLGQVKNKVSPTFAEDLGLERNGVENATSAAGGTFMEAIGTFDQYFERIATELSGSYLLGIEVQAADRDGRPHDVQVKVNRPGVEVRARKQYVIKPAGTSTTSGSAPAVGEPAAAPQPNPARDVEATPDDVLPVLRLAADYVENYEQKFLAIHAEERSEFRLSKLTVKAGREAWQVESVRRTAADLLIVKRPESAGWSMFRDTFEVDGKATRPREARLKASLLQGSEAVFETGTALTDESARNDIGFVDRSRNVPAAALLFLHPSEIGRFVFAKQGEQAVAGTGALQLAFVERGSPTIMQGKRGDTPAEGAFWLDPATGTILKSVVRWDIDGVRSEVTVVYTKSVGPGEMWLPTEMTEVYAAGSRKLECVTKYSNFSRFDNVESR